ncbi:MAG: DUF1772 domain-containing protein [Bacteroidia bacterium]|nr:DUF1772 domain-containing protein [Bacteroidia bacterium]
MGIFQTSLILAAFLCSLVAGFLFAYAIVVMPGIKSLNDRDFIRAFQVTDRVIQNNQPVFIIVWVGSAISLIISAIWGIERLHGLDFALISIATLAYLLGVQLPTIIIHLPLNNRLQTFEVDAMNETELKLARSNFEPRWNASNLFRTSVSSCVSVLLIILLFRL